MPDYKNSEMFNVIDEYIHNDKARRILKDRMINGMGIEDISEKHGVSVASARRIINENKPILFRYLNLS